MLKRQYLQLQKGNKLSRYENGIQSERLANLQGHKAYLPFFFFFLIWHYYKQYHQIQIKFIYYNPHNTEKKKRNASTNIMTK